MLEGRQKSRHVVDPLCTTEKHCRVCDFFVFVCMWHLMTGEEFHSVRRAVVPLAPAYGTVIRYCHSLLCFVFLPFVACVSCSWICLCGCVCGLPTSNPVPPIREHSILVQTRVFIVDGRGPKVHSLGIPVLLK